MSLRVVDTSQITFAQAISECLDDLFRSKRRVSHELFVNRMHERYAPTVANESTRLINQQLKKALRDYARQSDVDAQQDLPGMEGFPRILDLPSKDGSSELIRTKDANLPDLELGYRVRAENAARAQVRTDRYKDSLQKVRPLMRTDPEMQLRVALVQLGIWDKDEDD